MPNKHKVRTCEVCAVAFRPTYRVQRACSRACGVELRRATTRQRMCACGGQFEIQSASRGGDRCPRCILLQQQAQAAPPKRCVVCRTSFAPSGPQRCCGPACSREAKRRHDRRYNATCRPRRGRPGCERCGVALPRITRKRCDACLLVTKREAKRRERRRVRNLIRGVKSEGYTLSEIAQRDRWMCGLCRKRVAMTKVVPHPKAPTIDHVVPLADGGDDTRANVQLAHFMCNCRKSKRGTQQLAFLG